jgi:hypothetical protein
MLEMLENFAKGIREAFDKIVHFWQTATPRQKKWAKIGAAVLGGTFVAGGTLWGMSVAGIVLNIMFLNMIKDSDRATGFMQKYGWLIDVVLTSGAFLLSGGTFSGTMMNLMLTGWFSIFREVMFPPTDSDDGIIARIKKMFASKPKSPSDDKADGPEVANV